MWLLIIFSRREVMAVSYGRVASCRRWHFGDWLRRIEISTPVVSRDQATQHRASRETLEGTILSDLRTVEVQPATASGLWLDPDKHSEAGRRSRTDRCRRRGRVLYDGSRYAGWGHRPGSARRAAPPLPRWFRLS